MSGGKLFIEYSAKQINFLQLLHVRHGAVQHDVNSEEDLHVGELLLQLRRINDELLLLEREERVAAIHQEELRPEQLWDAVE